MKICCFTGHRIIDKSDIVSMQSRLDNIVERLVYEGFTEFRTGGAYGFDTFAALSILKIKEKNPDIKLRLFLACRNQAERWDERSKYYFEYVKSRADEIIYVSNDYKPDVYFTRDKALVDGSDLCVVYLKLAKGGTYFTRNYAQKKGVKLFYLYPCNC